MHIKPTDKAMKTYYDTMASYQQQGVTHEMAVRQAFFALLESTSKPMRWTLVAEHTLPNRKRIDGVLFDAFKLPRGYWEAKDSSDNLETEITKKIALDYPLTNIIFEDTRTGILYQNGQRVMQANITQPTDLAALLTRFFSYTHPQIEAFHTAVTTFQARIPELAVALLERIDEEQRTNPSFVAALEKFYALCQVSINSNISMTAIKEMLVQHLLTERLFRTIFNNPDFTRRNVIAAEGDTQCFPFYTYDEDGSNRQENITDWALEQVRQRYSAELCPFRQAQGPSQLVSKWDIFHYVYALLHHPDYRAKYADNLRRELPRIPLLGDSDTFHTLAVLGKQLADLHLHYEQANEYPLQWNKSTNVPWRWRVEKMRLSRNKDAVIVNDALTLVGIPIECFAYRLGSRSALEWVLDQYQVKTDKRSGMTSDPNRQHDPEYIVRLVGRVVTVSMETMALVEQIATVPLTM